MKRLYENAILDHFAHNDEMLFLTGPRQVGKTTISFALEHGKGPFCYLNWDNQDDQKLILTGPAAIADSLHLTQLKKQKAGIVFDEIHKYSQWKNFLKGFYDRYKDDCKILVTGSAKLDVYKVGGDSLMGRYFLYRAHPLSVAECVDQTLPTAEIRAPKKIKATQFDHLLMYGGFPKPFLQANKRFYNRWQQLWQQQLLEEDVRDLTQIQEIPQLRLLAIILKEYAGQLISYTTLAKHIRVSVPTIKQWINTLSLFYYCYTVSPWTANVSRSLLKQPKIYLWDWSQVENTGSRAENFIASHLLKAVHFWTDHGFDRYQLHFIRDKDKREVDFLVSKNNKPWLLVEVKQSNNQLLSKHLLHFQARLQVPHALQVVIDMPYVDSDCFAAKTPKIVPASTFLSQLV